MAILLIFTFYLFIIFRFSVVFTMENVIGSVIENYIYTQQF